MTVEEYEQYFEQLATSYVPIGHKPTAKRFARIDMEEVVTGLRNQIDINKFCLFLVSYEGKLQGKGDENMLDTMQGGFMIVRNTPPFNDREQSQVLNQAKQHGLQIVAKMIDDKRKSIMGQGPAFLRGVDLSTIEYMKVGPLFDSAYGYHFEFAVQQNESLLLDESQWIAS